MTKDETPLISEKELDAIRREAMEFANVGLYRYRLSGELLFLDRGALRLLGLEDKYEDPNELIGQKIATLLEHITPEGALREVTLEKGEVRGLEYHYRTLAGEERWVYHHSYLVDGPTKNEQVIQVISQDITTLKAAEGALTASKNQYRTLVEQSLQGIMVTRIIPTPKIVFVNQALAELAGVTRENLLALHPREMLMKVIHPDDVTTLAQRLTQRLAGTPNSDGYDFRILHADGEIRWVTAVSTHIEFESNPAIQTVILDVTARKRAEARRLELETNMQQAQKLESLGVLAGGIAHDFNNILAAILGHSELASVKLPPGSAAETHLEQIGHASERAAELCRLMMVSAGQSTGVTTVLDMNELVLETSRFLRVSLSKKVSFTVEASPEPLPLSGDASQLRQIVMNLISNAGEAIDSKDGAIRLEVGTQLCDKTLLESTSLGHGLPAGQYAVIEVCDSGPGMEESTIERIFEPFYSSKAEGRGLGLSTVLGIVRSHRGTLSVDSAPDHGTTFRVYLPLSTASQLTPKVPPSREQKKPLAGTVLLVDDEPAICSATGQMLERMGIERVIIAHDGMEAVEAFLQQPEAIDAVLLDLSMPKLDGREVYEAFRRAGHEVPVVFTSAYEADRVRDLLDNGDATFIQKPYRLIGLRDIMRKALAMPTEDPRSK